MKKYLKYVFYTLLAAVTLSAILIVIVATTVNPNGYKPLLIKMVQKTQHRTLTLKGNITLTFFPELGIQLGKASLSERNNPRPFARVNNVQIYIAPLPLLRNEWVVTRMRIDGLRANVIRYRNGTTNIDDWLRPQPDHHREPTVDQRRRSRVNIQQITIRRATLIVHDRQEGKKFMINHLTLTADQPAGRTPGTINLAFKFIDNDANLAVRLHSEIFFDRDISRYRLQKLVAEVNGQAAGIQHIVLRLHGNIAANLDRKSLHITGLVLKATGQRDGNLSFSLNTPRLDVTPDKTTSGKITLTTRFKQAATVFNAKLTTPGVVGSAKILHVYQANLSLRGKIAANTINGTLSTPLTIYLATQQISFPQWVAQLTVHNTRLPGGKRAIHLRGNAHANLAGKTAHLQFSGTFDQSTVQGTVRLSHLNPPTYKFRLAINRLNLDPYLSHQPQKTTAPQKPFHYALLRHIDANGKIRIGTLTLSNIKANHVRIEIQTRQGDLLIKPVATHRGPDRRDSAIKKANPAQASRHVKTQTSAQRRKNAPVQH